MSEIMTETGVIDGAYGGARVSAGVPSNGTSAVQTLTIGGTPSASASSGILFQNGAGAISPIALWSATNATLIANIQSALDTLLGTSETVVAVVSMTAGVGTASITFQNNSSAKLVPLLVAINQLAGTSPTASIANTTPGVTATHRGAPKGTTVEDQTNGNLYINAGTSTAPAWDLIAHA